MIPAKINPVSNTKIKETRMESIVSWFEQHKQSFYTLGWSYLRNQQQMEELFFQSILKVYKELPRFKKDISFETWVTSIFIHTCRDLSDNRSLQASEESEPLQDLFKALDQLNDREKEAIVLTYVKGISKEEAAYLLRVSMEEMKGLLFSGIQSLRKEMGYGPFFNGCTEYHKDYIDYLERTLDRSRKIDLEEHVYHCQDCQEDLGTFQDVMLIMLNLTERIEDLHVPSGFMENVKDRLAEEEKHRQQKIKRRKKRGFVFAGAFLLLMGIGFFTGVFANLYYTWTEEDEELRVFLQEGLGERLNLEAESNGVRIKIRSVIADDVQTLVFYEIEDTREDNQYMMNYHEGIFVKNEHKIMNRETYPRYYPPDHKSAVNKDEKNVYQGKLSLLPLTTDKGTIELQITKLQKLIRNSSDQNGFGGYVNTGSETGEWSFEIPVSKKPSVEYALNGKTEVEGIPVRFDKLIIAPTATLLQLGVHNEEQGKRIEFLNFNNLVVNNKKVKADNAGSFVDSQDVNWITFQMSFDPVFGEKPKELNVQFDSIHLTVEDQKTIELDASQEYPRTFEYAGSTISIDEVEIEQPTKIVISNHETENRAYQSLQFDIVGEDENEYISREMDIEGVVVDKNGKEYDMNGMSVPYEEIEQPLYFQTVYKMWLHNQNAGETVIPKRLEIYGYNTTKYLDDVVEISLE